jgi:ubiquinone/menaquinone biosynthesis C-methylase UbiE
MDIFERHADRYDEWYERNRELYEAELELLPEPSSPSLEVGVGTGRFAIIGIDVGVDISLEMLKIARKRGVECVRADASALPFKNNSFSSVYVIFTLCFLENPSKVLEEIRRVLKGLLVVCIIPADSGLGKEYQRKNSPFYSQARFYTEEEVLSMLNRVGFKVKEIRKRKLRHSENDFVCFIAEV